MILWTNATFYTMDNKKTTENVLTNNGIIIALGDDTKKYTPEKVIDLNNSFAFPGFVEAHMHLIGYGRKINGLVLKEINNKDLVLKEIKSYYNNEKLLIQGYFDINITKNELDLISFDNYIILRHNDYHSFTVNSKVLKDLKISSENGIVTDELVTIKIKKIWEENSKETLTKYANDALESLVENGFTSVHTDDLAYFNSYLETLDILTNISSLKNFRIYSLVHYEVLNDYVKYFNETKFLKAIQIKLFYDGTLSSKTALLNGYYTNTTNKGVRNLNNEEFLNILKIARKLNKGLAVHTIGDKATDEILSLLKTEKKAKELDRLIHVSLLSDDALLKISNIALDIQPLFIKSDASFISKNINHKTNIYPYNKLISNDLLVNLSSDAPVEEISPLLNLSILSDTNRYDLIKCYTVNPNKTIGVKAGMIKEGYLADFTIFDSDIININKDELLNTNIYMTVIDEKIVYKNKRGLKL